MGLALYLCFSPVPYLRSGSLDLSAASEYPYILMKNNAHAPRPEVEVANMYQSPTYFFFGFVVIHHALHLAIVRYWWHR